MRYAYETDNEVVIFSHVDDATKRYIDDGCMGTISVLHEPEPEPEPMPEPAPESMPEPAPESMPELEPGSLMSCVPYPYTHRHQVPFDHDAYRPPLPPSVAKALLAFASKEPSKLGLHQASVWAAPVADCEGRLVYQSTDGHALLRLFAVDDGVRHAGPRAWEVPMPSLKARAKTEHAVVEWSAALDNNTYRFPDASAVVPTDEPAGADRIGFNSELLGRVHTVWKCLRLNMCTEVRIFGPLRPAIFSADVCNDSLIRRVEIVIMPVRLD